MQEIGTDHVAQGVIAVSVMIGTALGTFSAAMLNKDINNFVWHKTRWLLQSRKRRQLGR